MTPVSITEQTPRMSSRSGKRIGSTPEIWAAESLDGLWSYQRTEEHTTPWVVTHLPTGWSTLFPSLPKSRRWTSDPAAIDWIRRDLRQMQQRAIEQGIGAYLGDEWISAEDLPRAVDDRLSLLGGAQTAA